MSLTKDEVQKIVQDEFSKLKDDIIVEVLGEIDNLFNQYYPNKPVQYHEIRNAIKIRLKEKNQEIIR